MARPQLAPDVAVPDAVARLARGYVFDDEGKAAGFLEAHPFLVPILEDGLDHLIAHFGYEARFLLDYDANEEGYSHEALWVRVVTRFDWRDAQARWDAFFDEWWADAAPAGRGLLHIDIDLRDHP